jgi:P27 family predicted phage terminase small subunit
VLKGEAAAEWDRMVERLTSAGILSIVDGAALRSYCQLHAAAEQLQRDADALTHTWFYKTTIDGSGQEHQEPKVHPLFAQLRQHRMALRVWLVEFGMTPSSRTRVKLPAGDAKPAMNPSKARYLNAITTRT